MQVHIADEETKYGFSEQEILELLTTGDLNLPNVEIAGLMGMATFTDDAGKVRAEFRRLKHLFDRLRNRPAPDTHMKILSMGMSGDYLIAVDEGSTMVRVGSLIFGERH